ncbi:MAG TPA: cytochrome c [Bryobacteraceae bacterium]|nr:cytochrome c [Bryobacteraceae bacterium]
MRCDPRWLLALVLAPAVWAQSGGYGLGQPATPDEIKKWDFAISPDGKELPPGSGNAVEGKEIYAAQCAMCHGKTGKEGPNDKLVGGQGTLNTAKPVKTIGSYWPYATTVWDYINRAMPYNKPGSLKPDEVYAVTAYLLYLNDIIPEHENLNATTLPKVKMPNRNGFVGDPRPDWEGSSKARR